MKKRAKMKKIDLSTVSGVAFCVLITIYNSQLRDIESVENLTFSFKSNPLMGKTVMKDGNNPLLSDILAITEDCSILMNAFYYLKDKNFLAFKENKDLGGDGMFLDFRLLADGIDIIEDAKNNPLRSYKKLGKEFNINFNVDSFVKAKNIVGVGGVAELDVDCCM